MNILGLLGLGLSAFGSYQQSQATQDAYVRQAEIERQNEVLAEYQAKDALDWGEFAVNSHRRQVGQLKGSQIASMAARGLDLGEGTAADVLASTDIMADYDEQMIRENAGKEAEGFRMMGKNYAGNAALLTGRAGRENPFLSGVSSLLTNANKVSEYWYGG